MCGVYTIQQLYTKYNNTTAAAYRRELSEAAVNEHISIIAQH